MGIKEKLKRFRHRIFAADFTILDELYWAQIYNSTIQNSAWLEDKSISPGRWAVGYNYLYVLYRILDDIRPTHILELGLGQSTKMIGQYAMHCNASDHIDHVVVEHDDEWVQFFFRRNKPLCQNTRVVTLPLTDVEKAGELFKVYDGFQDMMKSLNMRFHVLSIDGPLGASEHWGRRDILSCIPSCLEADFAIIFDDYGQGEYTLNTIKDTEKILHEHHIEFVKGMYPGVAHKGVCILTSKSWKFLTSL